MTPYLRSLIQIVGVAFLTPIVGMVAAEKPFNVLTFQWGDALTVGGSAATATLLLGLLGRLKGDKNTPTI